MKFLSFLGFSVTVSVLAGAPKESPSTPADLVAAATGYSKFQKMLPTPKAIGREFASRCEQPPEVKALQAKNGPHMFSYIQQYRNPIALGAAGAKTWPVGSVLVKEKMWDYDGKATEQKVDGVAGMIKRAPGTFPKSGDWEFFWVEKGKVQHTGMDSCAGCHSGAAKDYVFTTFSGAKAK